MGAKKTRILIACVPEAYTRLCSFLPRHDLIFVRTLTETHGALEAGDYDMILMGLHFDESRMFDLLRYVRADGKYARVPVVCFRGVVVADAKSKVVLEAVELACKAIGANAFFYLTAFTDDARGHAAVKKIIDGVFNAERNGS